MNTTTIFIFTLSLERYFNKKLYGLLNLSITIGVWRMDLEIKALPPNFEKDYSSLVEASKEGTLFHTIEWNNTISSQIKNYSVTFLGAFLKNELVAAFPIPIYSKFKFRGIKPFLTPYMGTLFKVKDLKAEKIVSWEKEINSHFAKHLKHFGVCFFYPFNHATVDLQPFKWNNFEVSVKYTYLLDLEDIDEIWRNMNKKRRNEIRKIERLNPKIVYDDVDSFVKLSETSLKRQKYTIKLNQVWHALFRMCREQNCGKIMTVLDDTDAPRASLFLVWDKKRSYYIGSGFDARDRGFTSYLIWESIKYAMEKLKVKQYDFEGSDIQNIEFYFRKFGGNITPIYYIKDKGIKIYLIEKLAKMFY